MQMQFFVFVAVSAVSALYSLPEPSVDCNSCALLYYSRLALDSSRHAWPHRDVHSSSHRPSAGATGLDGRHRGDAVGDSQSHAPPAGAEGRRLGDAHGSVEHGGRRSALRAPRWWLHSALGHAAVSARAPATNRGAESASADQRHAARRTATAVVAPASQPALSDGGVADGDAPARREVRKSMALPSATAAYHAHPRRAARRTACRATRRATLAAA